MSRRSPSARRVAHSVLLRVMRDGAYADRALTTALDRSSLARRDRGLATELVYGTLRHAIALDFVIGELAKRPLRKTTPAVLAALRLGAYQLLHTRVPARAAIHESVALIEQTHSHSRGFVNALLRKIATLHEHGELPDPLTHFDDPLEALAVAGSHPTWAVREVAELRGADTATRWVEANNQRPRLAIRVNRLRASVTDVSTLLQSAGVEVEAGPWPEALYLRETGAVDELPGFDDGMFTVQDPAAQLVSLVAAPQPGSVVLDACAAPGGKSTHLAELMGNEGRVLAVDFHPAKTRLIADASKRLGLDCIKPAVTDATDREALADLLYDEKISRVDMAIIDAPCSGLGTLRRNPELRYLSPDTVANLCKIQANLLDSVCEVVKPGGRVVYSVCTHTLQEGPQQIANLMKRNVEVELEPPRDEFGELVALYNDSRFLQTWPDRDGMDGFFVAQLSRRELLA